MKKKKTTKEADLRAVTPAVARFNKAIANGDAATVRSMARVMKQNFQSAEESECHKEGSDAREIAADEGPIMPPNVPALTL